MPKRNPKAQMSQLTKCHKKKKNPEGQSISSPGFSSGTFSYIEKMLRVSLTQRPSCLEELRRGIIGYLLCYKKLIQGLQ